MLAGADTGSAFIQQNSIVGNCARYTTYTTGPIAMELAVSGGTEDISANIFVGNALGTQAWFRAGGVTNLFNIPLGADGGDTTAFVSSTSPGFTALAITDAIFNA